MSRIVTVTYSVTYDLSQGEIADEYYESRHDRRDSKDQRKWFVIDRFVGHHNLPLFDKKAKFTITEVTSA
jgi:hypothetical protein